MVKVRIHSKFEKRVTKIKDARLRERIAKQVIKIVDNPEKGKPMRHTRKGTRELYIPPFRISYHFSKREDMVFFLALYHKDEQ